MLVPLRVEDLNSGFTGKKCLPPTQPAVLHQIRILNEFQNVNAMTQEPQDKDTRQEESAALESGSQFELPTGPFEFLVGFDNKGDDFIMETVQPSFRYPMDFNYLLQNFSAIAIKREIKPGHEATIPYSFPSESFAGRPFGINIALNYRDASGNRLDHQGLRGPGRQNVLPVKVPGRSRRAAARPRQAVPWFGEPKYTSTRVRHFNPAWNKTVDDVVNRFEKAKACVAVEFINKVLYYPNRWCTFAPYELEGEHGIGGLPKYVIYFKRPNDWRVVCVPLETASSVCRKWCGKQDNKLEEVSGIEGANFCHQTGFYGGNRTREGCAADGRGQSGGEVGVRDIEKQKCVRQAQAIADGAQETGTANHKDVSRKSKTPLNGDKMSHKQLISSSTVWTKPQHQQLATMQIVLDAFESDPNNASVKIHRKLAPFS
ncbi:hypothetical protein quinque_000065 [Culex quinquefasciatus]